MSPNSGKSPQLSLRVHHPSIHNFLFGLTLFFFKKKDHSLRYSIALKIICWIKLCLYFEIDRVKPSSAWSEHVKDWIGWRRCWIVNSTILSRLKVCGISWISPTFSKTGSSCASKFLTNKTPLFRLSTRRLQFWWLSVKRPRVKQRKIHQSQCCAARTGVVWLRERNSDPSAKAHLSLSFLTNPAWLGKKMTKETSEENRFVTLFGLRLSSMDVSTSTRVSDSGWSPLNEQFQIPFSFLFCPVEHWIPGQSWINGRLRYN